MSHAIASLSRWTNGCFRKYLIAFQPEINVFIFLFLFPLSDLPLQAMNTYEYTCKVAFRFFSLKPIITANMFGTCSIQVLMGLILEITKKNFLYFAYGNCTAKIAHNQYFQ